MYTIDRGLRADELTRRANLRLLGSYVLAAMAGVFVVGLSLFNPHLAFPISAAIFLLGFGCIAVRPVAGVYAITFLGLLADNVSAPYWPFLKNGSSTESWLFVHSSVIVSPLEVYLVWTLLVTIVHVAMRKVTLRRTPLFVPIASLMALVAVGFVWGIGTGGNLNIGLWELRPFATLFILYLVAANLMTERSQVRALFWTAIAAILVESVRTAFWYVATAEAVLHDSLIEHAAATHMNFVFVAFIIAWLVSRSGVALRILLPVASMPAAWVYLESERRSAIAALVIGVLLVLLFLQRQNLGRFLVVAPILLVVVGGYTAAFWNASGPVAFPASAIKAQIAPDEASIEDLASNQYREIEHYNILATIHANPVLGVGFGQKYDQPIPLPDISFAFLWWEYITHNGLLWIWLKTGFFGFVALFNLFGRSIISGMRSAVRERDPADTVMVAAAVIFIPMYLMFTYVDIAWGNQSMILLAVCLTIIAKSGQFLIDEANPEAAPEETSAALVEALR